MVEGERLFSGREEQYVGVILRFDGAGVGRLRNDL